MKSSLLASFALLLAVPLLSADEAADREVFFETSVRPLLAKRCFECHGPEKQQGELRLDNRKSVFEGNSSGPVVVPGKLNESRLWQVLQYDELDIQMPPEGKLAESELALIRQWIEQGGYWPEGGEGAGHDGDGIPRKPDGSIDFAKAAERHWAYQPVRRPEVPEPENPDLCRTTLDRFLLSALEDEGLSFSETASRETLVRRLSFDLLGLPPPLEEVREFVNDTRPEAWERLVDRFLTSPLYGQRWGRYWLDIARYADTKGYVFTENRFYPYSYTYRDYVISAFNDDVPYDQFIREQLAADQLGLEENDPRLAAMGFLTIGPRFLNRMPEIIDDRIDVVTRGLMGMTMACARCHDHKYDPIPTADYYSLYGVFNSCYEPDLPPLVGPIDESDPAYAAFAEELAKRQRELDDYKRGAHEELLKKVTDHAVDNLPAAARELGVLARETEIEWTHGEPRTKVREHWQRFLEGRLKGDDPVFLPWKRFVDLPEEELAGKGDEVASQLAENEEIPPALRAAFRQSPPRSRLDVVKTYGEVFAAIAGSVSSRPKNDGEQVGSTGPEDDPIHNLLFGPGSLSDVPPGEFSPLFERDNRDKIRNLEKKIDEWRVTSADAPPRSMVLFDKEKPVEPVIFVRGNPGRRGERVPRRVPQLLDDSPDAKFTSGSGRLELATGIASLENPLTARVWANRVWMYHFGAPLVSTPSDFGTRGAPPSNPELLDHLAWSFMHDHGWSIKSLHREILLSSAYRQSSLDQPRARKLDPENRLFWRQNRRRLDFEAMRDSLLHVAGLLDTAAGGRPVDLEKEPFTVRRTVYGLIDRNNLPGLLRTFDFPSPDASSPNRPETTVPQQALFAMNSPFIETVSDALAERVSSAGPGPLQQASLLIETVFSRPPTEQELEQLTAFLENGSLTELAQALLMTNEFLFVD